VFGSDAWEPEDQHQSGWEVAGRRFNPAHAAIIVCDEDPTQSLIERWPLRRDVLSTITQGSLGELILAGFDAPRGY